MAFILLVIPNEDILKEYHKKTFEIYKKIYLNQIENQKLAELRDFLLPMLMN
jgi:type I restriction enzyme S subunit